MVAPTLVGNPFRPSLHCLYRVGVSAPEPATRQPDPPGTKADWRRWALHRRRSRSAQEIADARSAITDQLLRLPLVRSATTVCTYLPLRTEPLAGELSDALHARGCRVLVPVTCAGAPLQWAEHVPGRATSTAAGSMPDPGPPLPPAEEQRALHDVSLVLVPALLVARDGTRLGRGGGHYDRSFALTALGSVDVRMAVLFDDEFVDTLPGEPHDSRVTAVVSPAGGVRMLPLR